MADIIRLLPDSIANQIAAGEVIQRPASVVKELVENAVDAGATSIQVLIKDAGRTLIRVIDNGKGMSETDARMSFERHATSKISSADDLFCLATFGFRGEALASIVAVAQVELVTRRSEDDVAVSLTLEASRYIASEATSAPVGTDMRVKNLFFNVPARRRFLKTNETEMRHIVTEFERVALIYPHIEFQLYHNDLSLYHYRAGILRQRIVDIFGNAFAPALLPVELDTSMVRVEGFVTAPSFARKRGAANYLFVNGRYMRHPYFHKALMQGYNGMIGADHTPSYFLHLEVEPSSIDVNIHPTKTEIKFEDEKAIWQMLMAMVRESLSKHAVVPTLDFSLEHPFDIPVYQKDAKTYVAPPTVTVDRHYNPFISAMPAENSGTSFSVPPTDEPWGAEIARTDGDEQRSDAADADEAWLPTSQEEALASSSPATTSVAASLTALLSDEFAQTQSSLMQFRNRYIIGTLSSGLMVLDQHRAHIRVLYEEKLSVMQHPRRQSQTLLFPETMECSAQERMVVDLIMDELTTLGFDLAYLGASSYSINALPIGVDISVAVPLLHALIAAVLEHKSAPTEEVKRSLALSYAQQIAIPYDRLLTQEEMQHLVASLFATTSPSLTPDNKTILTVMSDKEIKSRFNV